MPRDMEPHINEKLSDEMTVTDALSPDVWPEMGAHICGVADMECARVFMWCVDDKTGVLKDGNDFCRGRKP